MTCPRNLYHLEVEGRHPETAPILQLVRDEIDAPRLVWSFGGRHHKEDMTRPFCCSDIADKEGKPIGINSHIGRRPIAAFGNSDGDLQMLQYTAAGEGPRFMMYVHHDDADREWAYDRDSHIGRLDKGLEEAEAGGWTVVSMKNDWAQVFSWE